MAFLGKDELENELPKCIEGYDPTRIDSVAYELCLGNEVYLTDSISGKKEILNDSNSQVVIKPGQFALLLTKETVNIPLDILSFISIKFSQKIKGLVNISGFHVDPGFYGKIIFSVYNAGPATIVLDKDKPYFLMWFSELKSLSSKYDGKHKNQKEITADHVNALKGELASPNSLLERIKSNENLLENLQRASENSNNTVKWVAGILIGLAITIMGIGITLMLKSLSESSKFNEGYYAGLKEKNTKVFVDSALAKVGIDSIIASKINSILNNQKGHEKHE